MIIRKNTKGNSDSAPQFSLIMSAFNTEKYVGQALFSLVNQEFQDFEVIFIDDGSNDRTASIASAILTEWGGCFTFIAQENQGLGKSRNIGIDHARGKYLYFPDSDDVFDPQILKRVNNVIESTSPDVVVTGWRRMDEQGEEIMGGSKYHSNIPELTQDRSIRVIQFLEYKYPFWIGSFFVKNSLVKEHGIKFFTLIRTLDDLFFILKSIFYLESFEHIDRILSSYRKRRGSITQNKTHNSLHAKAMIHLTKDAKNLLCSCGKVSREVWDLWKIKDSHVYLDRLKSLVMEGRGDIYRLALKDNVFRERLFSVLTSRITRPHDRFKAFLALFFPGIFSYRYRHKALELQRSLGNDAVL